jgi:hypothetical protein
LMLMACLSVRAGSITVDRRSVESNLDGGSASSR